MYKDKGGNGAKALNVVRTYALGITVIPLNVSRPRETIHDCIAAFLENV